MKEHGEHELSGYLVFWSCSFDKCKMLIWVLSSRFGFFFCAHLFVFVLLLIPSSVKTVGSSTSWAYLELLADVEACSFIFHRGRAFEL